MTMTRKTLLAMAWIWTLAWTQNTLAQGVYIDYCDGTLASSKTGTLTGKPGSGNIDLAIRIPATTLEAYVGNQVTKVCAGIPSTVTTLPDSITVWLRHKKDGPVITSEKIAAHKGWMPVSLTQPYTIQANDEELWVGFGWTQTSKLTIISFAGPTHEDACWLGKDGVWTDFSNKGMGSLAVRAYVEGSVPTSDLEMTALQTGLHIYAIGQQIAVKGEVRNKATESALRPLVAWSLLAPKAHDEPDEVVMTDTLVIGKTLKEGDRADFTFTIDTQDLTAEGNYTIRCEVLWSDDREDDYATDNSMSAPVEIAREVFMRKMVVEEGTGTWCGYCVRGIVAFREMYAQHPERFVGLAVHQGDDFKLGYPYLNTRFSTYPNCIINRDGNVQGPLAATFEKYYNAMNTVAEANIDVTATYANKVITATADITYGLNSTDRDWRVIYLLVEDSLLATQTNYFAGGGMGEMGGFEDLPSYCQIYLNDVVRGAWPDTYGTAGQLPTSFQRGEHAQHTLSFRLPSDKTTTVKDPNHTWLCALLVDGVSGEIINAGTTRQIYGYNATPQGIGDVNDQRSTVNGQRSTPPYNLSGQRVGKDYRGITIQNGHLILRQR